MAVHPAVWTMIVFGTAFIELAAKETLHLQRMRQLVDDFTYVMHLETDRDLYNRIRSSFSLELKDYLSIVDSESATDTDTWSLVQQVLTGAFKLRAHAIKDSLASGRMVTVSRRDFASVANWSLDLLQEVILSTHLDLRNENRGMGLSPLELAVKLQMTAAASLLLENGAVVCTSLFPLKCSDALHYAVINEDRLTVSLIMDTLREEVERAGGELKQVLCSIVSEKGRNVAFSPLEIAHLHCLSGLSCVAYETLLTDVDMGCVLNATSDTRNLFTAVATSRARRLFSPNQTVGTKFEFGYSIRSPLNGPSHWLPRWTILGYQGRRSGWGVYDHFRVGQEGCDLPRVSFRQFSPHQLEAFFGKLRFVLLCKLQFTMYCKIHSQKQTIPLCTLQFCIMGDFVPKDQHMYVHLTSLHPRSYLPHRCGYCQGVTSSVRSIPSNVTNCCQITVKKNSLYGFTLIPLQVAIVDSHT